MCCLCDEKTNRVYIFLLLLFSIVSASTHEKELLIAQSIHNGGGDSHSGALGGSLHIHSLHVPKTTITAGVERPAMVESDRYVCVSECV